MFPSMVIACPTLFMWGVNEDEFMVNEEKERRKTDANLSFSFFIEKEVTKVGFQWK